MKLLTTTVRGELSLEFASRSLRVLFYDIKGALLMKTNLIVNGKSIHTLDASSLPTGTGIIVVQKGNAVYRKKFMKMR